MWNFSQKRYYLNWFWSGTRYMKVNKLPFCQYKNGNFITHKLPRIARGSKCFFFLKLLRKKKIQSMKWHRMKDDVIVLLIWQRYDKNCCFRIKTIINCYQIFSKSLEENSVFFLLTSQKTKIQETVILWFLEIHSWVACCICMRGTFWQTSNSRISMVENKREIWAKWT